MKKVFQFILVSLLFVGQIDRAIAGEIANHFLQKFESVIDLKDGISLRMKAEVTWFDPDKEKYKYIADVRSGSATSDDDFPIYKVTIAKYRIGKVRFTFGDQGPKKAQVLTIYAKRTTWVNMSEPGKNEQEDDVWGISLENYGETLLSPLVELPSPIYDRYNAIEFSDHAFLPKELKREGSHFPRPEVKIGDVISTPFGIEATDDGNYRLSSNEGEGVAEFVRVE